MSVYRCDICDDYKDADIHGCEEHREDPFKCICSDCHMYSDPEFGCFRCGKANRYVKYCKITDQYYCEECV